MENGMVKVRPSDAIFYKVSGQNARIVGGASWEEDSRRWVSVGEPMQVNGSPVYTFERTFDEPVSEFLFSKSPGALGEGRPLRDLDGDRRGAYAVRLAGSAKRVRLLVSNVDDLLEVQVLEEGPSARSVPSVPTERGRPLLTSENVVVSTTSAQAHQASERELAFQNNPQAFITYLDPMERIGTVTQPTREITFENHIRSGEFYHVQFNRPVSSYRILYNADHSIRDVVPSKPTFRLLWGGNWSAAKEIAPSRWPTVLGRPVPNSKNPARVELLDVTFARPMTHDTLPAPDNSDIYNHGYLIDFGRPVSHVQYLWRTDIYPRELYDVNVIE
jgi:hypothetical protein